MHRLSGAGPRLAVITVISNPRRYKSRYRLYREFAQRVAATPGADLFTVECAFGERPWAITEAGNPRHLQVRTPHELWLKENLMNLGAEIVPAEYQYLAFVDADFAFANPHWAHETIQALQHHPVVQMFSRVHYLDSNHEEVSKNSPRISFAERWRRGMTVPTGTKEFRREVWPYERPDKPKNETGNAEWGPPGGAWAFRRETLLQLGGLVDFCALGSADWWMAQAMAGTLADALPGSYALGFREMLHAWAERAERAVNRDIGVVRGAAWHYWHGPMENRGYGTREEVLKRNQFDPRTDLYRGEGGVIALVQDGSERLRQLRDDFRAYFCSRNEDELV